MSQSFVASGDVLVLHFNVARFPDHLFRTLLERLVTFPIEGLDLKEHFDVQRPHPSEAFDLTAGIFHIRVGNRGFYVAAVSYHELSRTWFLFEDDTMTALDSIEDYLAEARPLPRQLYYKRRM